MRTKEEILKEIEDVERYKFFIDMADSWSIEDKTEYQECCRRLKELKKELVEHEN